MVRYASISLSELAAYARFYRSLRWRRVVCPRCGNRDPERLRVKYESKYGRFRIYCLNCKSTTTIRLKHADYLSPLAHFKA